MGWVKAAAITEIAPGQCIAIREDGKDLAIFNIEGQFYCIEDACPHHYAPLSDGWVEGDTVVCPWHAWQISLRTGESVRPVGCQVPTYPCKIEDGSVFVEV